MDYFKIVIIFLMIWVLISLSNYKYLLSQIVKRLSPEEQRDLKDKHEKLQESYNLLEQNIDSKNFELKCINEKNDSVGKDLKVSLQHFSEAKEENRLKRMELESIQLELAKSQRVIKDNDKLLSEKDSCIRELQREVSAQTEAVNFAENKQNQHEPVIKYKQKKNSSTNAGWSGNSGRSDWTTCKACGSNSPNLCRCSE